VPKESIMTIPLSDRISSLGGYAFAEVDKLVQQLRDQGAAVIDFGVGDPRAPTPELIREAAHAAMKRHASSGYPSYIGSAAFRTACAEWVGRRFGVEVDPAVHVSATIGSKEAVFHAPLAFVNPGDVVVSPDPGYPPYVRGTQFAGGVNHRYPLHASNGYVPDLGAIPDDVLARTKMLWLCYPNSPTGAMATLEFYEEAARFCRERDILLCSDEAYSELWYGDEPPVSALQTGLSNVLTFFSMSKRSAMTGWRCGYVVGDADAVGAFRKLKTNIDSGTPDFVQDAAIAALADEEHVAGMRADYRTKRDLICDAFVAAGLPDCRPEGTMYVWQRVPAGMTAEEFAKRLLDPALALVATPGTWLSSGGDDDPGEGHVRLALVPTVADCEEAARRIRTLAF
jgi:LL-diaminopimelate aminotransferase